MFNYICESLLQEHFVGFPAVLESYVISLLEADQQGNVSCWCLELRGENTCLVLGSCFLASGLQCKNIFSKKHKLCSIAHF